MACRPHAVRDVSRSQTPLCPQPPPDSDVSSMILNDDPTTGNDNDANSGPDLQGGDEGLGDASDESAMHNGSHPQAVSYPRPSEHAPVHNHSSSARRCFPVPDNPYGSDVAAASVLDSLDEDVEDEDEVAELDQEFSSWHDDDCPAAEDDDPSGPSRDGCPRSSLPTWLKNHYYQLRDRLVSEMKRNSSHMPTCYDQFTFFDGPENRFLAARSSYDGSAAGIFHQPRYFIWLPHLLVDRIPCPACKAACRTGTKAATVYLQKHGFVNSPRRVVGLEENIFIVGYHYHCGHQSCGKNYQSWSPAILRMLPNIISDQFPFRLTHRCGLTDQLASLLREAFRGGVSPCVFTTLVRAMHYHHFDQLRCQFLEMIADHNMGSLRDCWTSKRPFGEFGDLDGYAGYVPSERYFGQFYDAMVEEEAPELQHIISSRPANVLKHDHSFKVIKRMKRHGGVPFFSALHTFLNEYSEIHGMTFTPSKGHDGWAPVLQAILPSLREYGHPEPKVIFTDNVRADKDKLLSIFPSLSMGVTPVERLASLKPLTFPSDWEVIHLTNTHQVNLRFNIIMSHHSDSSPVIVGFTMYWPINTSSGVSGPVALLAFTYQKIVYLVQTIHFLQDGHLSLPHALTAFLQSSAYVKVGLNIAANLKQLSADCIKPISATPFSGHQDLGFLATSQNAAPHGSTSLSVLCSLILHHQLKVDPQICISPAWGQPCLRSDFVDHAALEAFAVWSIYTVLQQMDTPQAVTHLTAGGTKVTMFAPDGREIAHGVIALDRPAAFRGVNVTPTRALMVVQEVLVPAYLISPTLTPSHQPMALSTFGAVPFILLCQANHLRTSSQATSSQLEQQPLGSALPDWSLLLSQTPTVATGPEAESCFENNPIDIVEGQFAYAAIFLTDPDDKRAVEAFLQKSNMTFEMKLMSKPKWVLARVRRYVPPPEILFSRVAAVIKTFGPLKDSTTGHPLFTEKAWEVTRSILEHIRNGHYSDPPGISLYFEIGKDKNGLTMYRCIRGTNDLEGGVHQNLIRRFTSFNVSPHRAINMLLDYAVGTENRTGKSYIGHFDIRLKNRVASLVEMTAGYFNQDPSSGHGKWVNGNNYKHTNESFGVLPFTKSVQRKLSMLPYHHTFAQEQKIHHRYLSERQETRFAVLPIHTRSERALFQLYADTSPHFSSSSGPNFTLLASDMNSHADGHTIFYKLPEHLKSYYKTWLDYLNEKTSTNLSVSATKHIRILLQASQTGMPHTIPTAQPRPLENTVAPPSIASNHDPNPWNLHKTLVDHRLTQSALQYHYGDAFKPASSAIPSLTALPLRKRPAASESELPESTNHSTSGLIERPGKKQKPSGGDSDCTGTESSNLKKRRDRRCKHCFSTGCMGHWAVQKCPVFQHRAMGAT
ncbi:hypothetical protein L210DRAFT_3766619 [Boletus edulis BED1]|uniref:DUF6729 domain-containing protein n=1 Tax=Boletus edulis BED1 TaxID=1328754 RepID=A0AAD4BCK4_BOLED|nr:hypothetical protein L210DRAFT_3766619 [Boletus edulis BED1]